jgi:hypothetical protein
MSKSMAKQESVPPAVDPADRWQAGFRTKLIGGFRGRLPAAQAMMSDLVHASIAARFDGHGSRRPR